MSQDLDRVEDVFNPPWRILYPKLRQVLKNAIEVIENFRCELDACPLTI